jgi:hypothetical protein
MLVTDVLKGANIKDILAFLNSGPDDQLFTVQELHEQFGVPESTIKSSQTLRPYRTNFLGKNYFGSVSTVAEFEKKIEEGR